MIQYLRELHFASVVVRLALAMLLGGCIGLERGRKRRPAGFRTYMLVCLGAALTVLALCAYPFLQLGIQYLLYKLTAFLASVIGDTELCGLIGGLGGAFGLILGMVGSCALVLLVSILASAAVVTS